jgi:hypothetical protein
VSADSAFAAMSPSIFCNVNAVDEHGRVAAVAQAFAVSGYDQAVILYRGFRGDASNDACNFHVPLMRFFSWSSAIPRIVKV